MSRRGPLFTVNHQANPRSLSTLRVDELLEHATWLRTFAAALVRDPNEAEDLVQGALGAARRTPQNIQNLRAYLAGTVRNLAWKNRREEARRRAREEDRAKEQWREAPAADEQLMAVETMRIVLEQVAQLPRAQGRAISLRFIEELPTAEIAQREGCSPTTVRSNLSRGLATLRSRLDERGGGRDAWLGVLAPWALSPQLAVPSSISSRVSEAAVSLR